MIESATEYQLKLVDWQFFCTFTWRNGKLGSVASRETDLWSFLRTFAADSGCKLCRLLVVVRWERGELGERPHAHALLAGFPQRTVSVPECFRRQSLWNRENGLARLRVIDNQRNQSVGRLHRYMVKAIGTDGLWYELRKFDMADRLVVNDMAWGAMARASGVPFVPQLRTA